MPKILIALLSLAVCVTGASAQTADRAGDAKAIRAHIDTIFRAYIAKDRETVRATHSADWRGFLIGSHGAIRGIDEYMNHADYSLKSTDGGMTGYTITEFDVIFHGDVAVVCYVADTEGRYKSDAWKNKLRVLDVYEKRAGEWIQVASNTDRHPESVARQMSDARPVDPETRAALLEARARVWRAFFANDRAALDELIPADAIAIDAGQQEWSDRAKILAGAEWFASSGAKLVRLEFPRTDVQAYGATFVVYTTYLYELEMNGKRETKTGRGTEVFVSRNGRFVNTGWHLDSGN